MIHNLKRTTIRFDFKVSSYSLISFSLNYITIDTNSIYKNSIYASIYKKVYRNLTTPKFSWFREYISNQAIDFNVRIKGLRAIRDSTTYQKPLNNSNILIKKIA